MEMEKDIIERITELSSPVLEERGLDLVDIEFRREAQGCVLRLFIEKKEGGVSLDDCASVSREIGVILEVEDPIPYKYNLEVSSPGLTRPLKKGEDFRKFQGRLVRILTKYPVENMNDFKGTLLGVYGDNVMVQSNDKTWAIPLAGIARANLDF